MKKAFFSRILRKKMLYVPPGGLNCICVGTSLRVFEGHTMIDDFMSVAFSLKTLIPSSAIRSNYRARLYLIFYDWNQGQLFPVGHWNKKTFSSVGFNTTKDPLAVNAVSLVVYSPAEHEFVDLDDYSGPSNFFWMAEKMVVNHLTAFICPLADGFCC